jgi:hypothetical protein
MRPTTHGEHFHFLHFLKVMMCHIEIKCCKMTCLHPNMIIMTLIFYLIVCLDDSFGGIYLDHKANTMRASHFQHAIKETYIITVDGEIYIQV